MEGRQDLRRLSFSNPLFMADDLIDMDHPGSEGLQNEGDFLLNPVVDPEIFKASPPKRRAKAAQSSKSAPTQEESAGESQVKKRKPRRNKLRNSMAWDQAFQTNEEPLLLQELEPIDIITLSESPAPPRTTKRPTAIAIPRNKSFEAETSRDRTLDSTPFVELQSNMPIPSAGPLPKPLVRSERRKTTSVTESMAWNKAFQEGNDEDLLTADVPLAESPVLISRWKESRTAPELCESSNSCITVSQQKEQLSTTKSSLMTAGVLDQLDGRKIDAASSQAVESLLSSVESLRTEASTSSVAWLPTADEAESEAKHSTKGPFGQSILEQALTPVKGTPSKGERRRKQPVSLHRPTSSIVAIESAIQHGTRLRLPGRYNPNPPPKPSSMTPEASSKGVPTPSKTESTRVDTAARGGQKTEMASKDEESKAAAAIDVQNETARKDVNGEPQTASEDMKALQAQLAAIQLERDALQAKLEALSASREGSQAPSETPSQQSQNGKGEGSRDEVSALKETAMLGLQPVKTGRAPKPDVNGPSKARVPPQLATAVRPAVAKGSPAPARPSFLKKPSAKKDFFQGTTSAAVRTEQSGRNEDPAKVSVQPKTSTGLKAPSITSKCSLSNGQPSPQPSLHKRPSLLRKSSELRTLKSGAFSKSAIQVACSVPLPASPGIASPSPARKPSSPAVSRLSKPAFRNPNPWKSEETEGDSKTAVTFLNKLATVSKVPTAGSSRLKPPGFMASSIAPEMLTAACSVPFPNSPRGPSMLPRVPSSISTATIATKDSENLPGASLLKPPSSLVKLACVVPLPFSPEKSEPLRPCATETQAVESAKEEKEPAGGQSLIETVAEKQSSVTGPGDDGGLGARCEAIAAKATKTQSHEEESKAKDSKESHIRAAAAELADKAAYPSTPTELLPSGRTKEADPESEAVRQAQPSVFSGNNDLPLTEASLETPPKEAWQAVDPCHVSPSETAESYPSLQLPLSSCLQPTRLSKKPGLPTIYSPALVDNNGSFKPKGDPIADEEGAQSPAARALFSSNLGRATRVVPNEEQIVDDLFQTTGERKKQSGEAEESDEPSSASETVSQSENADDKEGHSAEMGESGLAKESDLVLDGEEVMRPVEVDTLAEDDVSQQSEALSIKSTESEETVLGEERDHGGVRIRKEEEGSVVATGFSVAGEASARGIKLEQGVECSTEAAATVEEAAVSEREVRGSEENPSGDEPTDSCKSPKSVLLPDNPSEIGSEREDPNDEVSSETPSALSADSNQETSPAEGGALKTEANGDQEGVDVTLGSPESDAMSHGDVEKLLQLEAVLLGALEQEQAALERQDENGGSLVGEPGTADDVSIAVEASTPHQQVALGGSLLGEVATAAHVTVAAALSNEGEAEADVSGVAGAEEDAPVSNLEMPCSSGNVQRAGDIRTEEVQADVQTAESESEALPAAAESASDVIARLRARQAAVAALLGSPKQRDAEEPQQESLGVQQGNAILPAEGVASGTSPSEGAKLCTPSVERALFEHTEAEKGGEPRSSTAGSGDFDVPTQQSGLEQVVSTGGESEDGDSEMTEAESPALVASHSPEHVTSSGRKSAAKAGEEVTKAMSREVSGSVASPVSAVWEEAWFGIPSMMCPGEETGEIPVSGGKGESRQGTRADGNLEVASDKASADKGASLESKKIGPATPTESDTCLQGQALLQMDGQDALAPNTPNLLSLAIPLFLNPEPLADASKQALETRFEAQLEDETQVLWDECLAKVRGKKRTSPSGLIRTSVGKKTPLRRSAEDLRGGTPRSSPPGLSPTSILSRTPGRLRHALSESAPGLAGLMQSMMEAKSGKPGTNKSGPAVLGASPVVKPRGKAVGKKKKPVGSPVGVNREEDDLDARIRAIEAMGEEALASKSGRVQSSPPDKKDGTPANPYSPVKKRECGPFDCTKKTGSN